MAYPGVTLTKFGRNQVAEPPHLSRMALHLGGTLKASDFSSPAPILDQEDFAKQGISVPAIIPGAPNVDALGACVFNATVAHLIERILHVGGDLGTIKLAFNGTDYTLSVTDSKGDEVFAIVLYHLTSDNTGEPATEFPPTDCGSTGYDVCQELLRLGFISNFTSGQSGGSLAQMLQTGSVIEGTPWFNSWMTPDSSGFVDGDGSMNALVMADASGIAGGHETCVEALEKIVQSETGVIDMQASVVRVRNSWSKSWGDDGHFLLHLSTLDMLASMGAVDFKQVQVTNTEDKTQ